MINELASLEELQTLDSGTLDHRNELVTIPENLEAMRGDVAHVGEILEREKERLTEAEQWRLDREKGIASQNELLIKSKAKLQVARNEKENQAAQREIDTIRKTIQEREEETLKVMEAIEQYRVAIDKHTSEFAELEKQLADSEEEAEARMAELKADIAKTEARRAEIASRIPEKTMRLYDRIQKRLGQAVVEAVDGHCAGCNIGILAQMYNELQRGDKLYQCPNCYRILIYKEKSDPNSAEEE